MDISVRSALTAGVAALSASAIALAPALTPLPESSFAQAHSTAASCAEVDLRAVTQPLLPQAPTTAQLLDAVASLRAAAVTPGIITTPGLTNLANAIDAAYLAIEPWVDYAFDVASSVVGWIPYGWIIADQIPVIYNFVESLVHSGVFNTTDWLRGEGSALKNIADWTVDAGLSLIWLGLDELGAWVPLPPLPWYPPRAPYADLPEGFLGDAVVGLSQGLADVSHAIWNTWEPIKDAIDRGVVSISDFLDTIARVPFVPFVNFELTESWELIYRGVDSVTGFAHDMISAGNQFVVDTIDGDGLIPATATAFNSTVDSIAARGGEAVQTWADWGRDQIDYLVHLLTPGSTLAAVQQRASAPAVVATLSSTAPGLTLTTETSIDSTEHAGTAKDSTTDGTAAKSDRDVTATDAGLDMPAADRSSTSEEGADKRDTVDKKGFDAGTSSAVGERNATDHTKAAKKPERIARNHAKKSDRGGSANAAHDKGAARATG